MFGQPISVSNSAKKNAQKTGIFGPETPFPYISALFGPFYGLFGPSLTFLNTQTLFLALLVTLRGRGRGPKDIHYAFFGNVVRGKSAFFRLVVRNGFAHFVRKAFARRKLLPGKFWGVAPLSEQVQALISGVTFKGLEWSVVLSSNNTCVNKSILLANTPAPCSLEDWFS